MGISHRGLSHRVMRASALAGAISFVAALGASHCEGMEWQAIFSDPRITYARDQESEARDAWREAHRARRTALQEYTTSRIETIENAIAAGGEYEELTQQEHIKLVDSHLFVPQTYNELSKDLALAGILLCVPLGISCFRRLC